MEAIITIGVSASGKTTWAKDFVAKNPNWIIICRDDIRTALMGGKLDWSKWNWKREDEVTKVQENMILDAKKNGQSIIIADTNLPTIKNGKIVSSHGDKLAKKLKLFGYEVSWKEFDISLDEAIKRDYSRECSVGENVIRNQYDKWLAYKGR